MNLAPEILKMRDALLERIKGKSLNEVAEIVRPCRIQIYVVDQREGRDPLRKQRAVLHGLNFLLLTLAHARPHPREVLIFRLLVRHAELVLDAVDRIAIFFDILATRLGVFPLFVLGRTVKCRSFKIDQRALAVLGRVLCFH